jgi:hypothetical protein
MEHVRAWMLPAKLVADIRCARSVLDSTASLPRSSRVITPLTMKTLRLLPLAACLSASPQTRNALSLADYSPSDFSK